VFASASGDEPLWNEAVSGPDRDKWLEAQDVEISMLDFLHTFNVVADIKTQPHFESLCTLFILASNTMLLDFCLQQSNLVTFGVVLLHTKKL
jgi:hypothetical protein